MVCYRFLALAILAALGVCFALSGASVLNATTPPGESSAGAPAGTAAILAGSGLGVLLFSRIARNTLRPTLVGGLVVLAAAPCFILGAAIATGIEGDSGRFLTAGPPAGASGLILRFALVFTAFLPGLVALGAALAFLLRRGAPARLIPDPDSNTTFRVAPVGPVALGVAATLPFTTVLALPGERGLSGIALLTGAVTGATGIVIVLIGLSERIPRALALRGRPGRLVLPFTGSGFPDPPANRIPRSLFLLAGFAAGGLGMGGGQWILSATGGGHTLFLYAPAGLLAGIFLGAAAGFDGFRPLRRLLASPAGLFMTAGLGAALAVLVLALAEKSEGFTAAEAWTRVEPPMGPGLLAAFLLAPPGIAMGGLAALRPRAGVGPLMLGASMGILAALFIGLPVLSVKGLGIASALLYVSAAWLLNDRGALWNPPRKVALPASAAALLLLGAAAVVRPGERSTHETRIAGVSVEEKTDLEEGRKIRDLRLQGAIAWSSRFLEGRARMLGAVTAILTQGNPDRVLFLGPGPGEAERILRIFRVNRIDVVAPHPALFDASPEASKDTREDCAGPTVLRRTDNLTRFLSTLNSEYDLLFTAAGPDPSRPGYVHSLAFLEGVADALKPGGLHVLEADTRRECEASLIALVRDFRKVFPYARVFASGRAFILLGSKRPIRPDLTAWNRSLGRIETERALKAFALSDIPHLLAAYLCTERGLDAFLKTASPDSARRDLIASAEATTTLSPVTVPAFRDENADRLRKDLHEALVRWFRASSGSPRSEMKKLVRAIRRD